MPLFTRKEVRHAAAEVTRSLADGETLEEALFESQTDAYFARQALDWESREGREFDIFLSHAYADKILIAGLYSLLTASGFSVYVDWVHDHRREDRGSVTPANAAALRNRMKQCRTLFCVTTEHYKESKWMPWECGYFDGLQSRPEEAGIRSGHVAILPVVESDEASFVGVEFFGLYPTVHKGTLPTRNLHIHLQDKFSRTLHFDEWVNHDRS